MLDAGLYVANRVGRDWNELKRQHGTQEIHRREGLAINRKHEDSGDRVRKEGYLMW